MKYFPPFSAFLCVAMTRIKGKQGTPRSQRLMLRWKYQFSYDH